ncbi:MAG: hypothetical protein R3195_01130 [Gemmatimonadota bacterium]|nr:hypothetical protein [Gemmatimonadota bacterium]
MVAGSTRTPVGARPSRGLALALALIGAACGGEDVPPEPETPPEPRELVIFVYDRSTSIPDHTLELATQLTNERVMALDHEDRVAGVRVLQQSLAEERDAWSESVPARTIQDFEVSRDSVAKFRFLLDATVLLADLADTKGRDDIGGTDILSTLHDVAAEMRAYPDHDATLYLFSDMLQSNYQIDMEGLRLMPPDGWVREAHDGGRLPDLSGLCVVVVGARVDTPASQRVKAFWDEYFQTTGATLVDSNYMLRPVRLPLNPCG